MQRTTARWLIGAHECRIIHSPSAGTPAAPSNQDRRQSNRPLAAAPQPTAHSHPPARKVRLRPLRCSALSCCTQTRTRVGPSLPTASPLVPRYRLDQSNVIRNVSTKLRQLGSAISGASDLQGGRRQRVDPDRWRRSEDLRLATDETFGMGREGARKYSLTRGQKRIGQAVVDAVRGQQSKPGVMMLMVVPSKELPAESARVLQRTEPLGKGRAILERLEVAL